MRSFRRSEEGFTLTEVMVALFLLTVVSAVFLPTLQSTLFATRHLEAAARANDASRLAIAQLDREFRAAEQVCEPSPGATADRIRFRTRAYTATTSGTGYLEVTYELRDPDGDGRLTTLQRSSDGGTTWRTVIENVVNQDLAAPLFEVAGGTGSGAPSEGKVVIIDLWVDINPSDPIGPRLTETELSGRNIWTPNAPAC